MGVVVAVAANWETVPTIPTQHGLHESSACTAAHHYHRGRQAGLPAVHMLLWLFACVERSCKAYWHLASICAHHTCAIYPSVLFFTPANNMYRCPAPLTVHMHALSTQAAADCCTQCLWRPLPGLGSRSLQGRAAARPAGHLASICPHQPLVHTKRRAHDRGSGQQQRQRRTRCSEVVGAGDAGHSARGGGVRELPRTRGSGAAGVQERGAAWKLWVCMQVGRCRVRRPEACGTWCINFVRAGSIVVCAANVPHCRPSPRHFEELLAMIAAGNDVCILFHDACRRCKQLCTCPLHPLDTAFIIRCCTSRCKRLCACLLHPIAT